MNIRFRLFTSLSKIGLLLILPLVTLGSTTTDNTRQTIHFSCTSRPEQSDFQYAFNLYKSAFEALGYDFQMSFVPGNPFSNDQFGESFDGDCGRLPNFLADMNVVNLITVNTPIRTATMSSWKLDSDSRKLNREETRIQVSPQILAITPYLEKMGFQIQSSAANYESLLLQLKKGNTDRIVIYEAEDTQKSLSTLNNLKRDETLMVVPIQPLLHKRHESLLQPLASQLQQLLSNNSAHPVLNRDSAPQQHSNKNVLSFSCALPPRHPATKATQAMYEAAFKSIGKVYRQVYVHPSDESALLARGSVDGSCGRAKEFQINNSAAFRISIPAGVAHMRLWSRLATPEIDDLSQLAETSSVVVSGKTTKMDLMLRHFPGNVITVRTPEQAFKMVIAGRADYFLGFTTAATDQLHAHHIKSPLFLTGSIKYGAVYPYLHPRHQDLIQPLTQAMRAQLGDHSNLLDAWIQRPEQNFTH